MKKYFMLMAVAIISFGCEKLDGQLNIAAPIKLVTTKGSTITVKPGTYASELKISNSKKLTLKLDDSGQKFDFKIPKNSLPDNGTFKFLSATSGQPVDVNGEIKTVITDSGRRTTTETCHYQVPYQVCSPLPNGGQTCHIQYRQVMGMKWVEYFNRTTQRDVKLAIHNKSLNDNAADFFGDIEYTQRVVVNESMCR